MKKSSVLRSSSPHILVINAYSWYNKGDYAILLSELACLRKAFPNAQISVLLISTKGKLDSIKQTKARLIGFLDQVFDISQVSPSAKSFAKLLALILRILLFAVIFRLSPNYAERICQNSIVHAYLSADIVLSTGGTIFTESQRSTSFYIHSLQVVAAILFRKRVMIFGQSIGPIQKRLNVLLMRAILNRVHVIALREAISKEWLDRLGVRNGKINVTSDPAFLLTRQKSNRAERILAHENITHDRGPFIGLCPRYWSFPNAPARERLQMLKNYVESLVDTVDKICRDRDATFVLIPMCTSPRDDDRQIIRVIHERVKEKGQVSILTGDYDPLELINIFEQFDLVLGSRMHSNILALIAGTPTVCIACEHKTLGLIRSLGMRDEVIPIDSITSQALIRLTENSLRNRKKSKTVMEAYARAHRQASLNIQLLSQLLRERNSQH